VENVKGAKLQKKEPEKFDPPLPGPCSYFGTVRSELSKSAHAFSRGKRHLERDANAKETENKPEDLD